LTTFRSRFVLIALLGLGAVLRLVEAYRRPLQVDEALTLNLADAPLRDALVYLRTEDVHPPLLTYALHMVEAWHVPDIAVRMAMALIGLASVALLYYLVRLWADVTAASIAAVCAAFMPSLLFYDSWIRMYAPFEFLALGSFVLLSLAVKNPGGRFALWFAWAICTALMWYTLYLGLVVTAGQLLFVIALRRSSLVYAIGAAGIAALLWLPQLATFVTQLPNGGVAWPWGLAHPLTALLEIPGGATLDPQYAGERLRVYAAVVAWSWLALAAFVAWRSSRSTLLPWLLAPSILLVVYSLAFHKALYFERYHLLAADGLAALTGVGVAALWNAKREWAMACAAAALIVLVSFSAAFALVPAFYTASWPSVARIIATATQPQDLVVLEQGSSIHPLQRMGAFANRSALTVFAARDIPIALREIPKHRRVLYVSYQSDPVDPTNAVYTSLAAGRHVAGVWALRRELPAENVDITLFEK